MPCPNHPTIRTFEDQKRFFQSFSKIQTIVRSQKIIVPARPKFLEEKRKILLETFNLPHVKKVCQECRGSCCNLLVNLPPMEMADALYIFTNPNFELPEPNWLFLKEKNERKTESFMPLYCLFSSPEGCKLKEFRPLTCLCATCHKLRELKEIQVLLYPPSHPFHYSPFYDDLHNELCKWYKKLQEKNLNRFSKEDPLFKILSINPTSCIHSFIAFLEN